MNELFHSGGNDGSREEKELERLLNRGELFFWFCALRLKTKTGVKSFDSFVVEG